MVTSEIKWLYIGTLAQRFLKTITEILTDLSERFPLSESAIQIIKSMEEKARMGNIPDPDSLENIAKKEKDSSIFLLAGLVHREFGRFLAANILDRGAFVEETFGAYIKAIGILLGLLILKKDKWLENELLRSLMEIKYVVNESKVIIKQEYMILLKGIETMVLSVLKVLGMGVGNHED